MWFKVYFIRKNKEESYCYVHFTESCKGLSNYVLNDCLDVSDDSDKCVSRISLMYPVKYENIIYEKEARFIRLENIVSYEDDDGIVKFHEDKVKLSIIECLDLVRDFMENNVVEEADILDYYKKLVRENSSAWSGDSYESFGYLVGDLVKNYDKNGFIVNLWKRSEHHSKNVFKGTLKDCISYADSLDKEDVYSLDLCYPDGRIYKVVYRSK